MVNTEIMLIIFFAAKDGEALYSQQKQDCGSDHEHLIAKFRLKLKKVGKTTRSFSYELNQIRCDYTAAKSLQSCPTLCHPTDGSPPSSSVPGILQARTLEWVAISFSNA